MIEKKRDNSKMDINYLLEILKNSPQELLFEGASEEEISSLEEVLGVALPSSFKAFLRVSDGASLYHDSVEVFGTKKGEGDLQMSLIEEKEKMKSLPPTLIPFSHSDGFYCFDSEYSEGGEPRVVKWNGEGKIPVPSYNSFADWLEEVVKMIEPKT